MECFRGFKFCGNSSNRIYLGGPFFTGPRMSENTLSAIVRSACKIRWISSLSTRNHIKVLYNLWKNMRNLTIKIRLSFSFESRACFLLFFPFHPYETSFDNDQRLVAEGSLAWQMMHFKASKKRSIIKKSMPQFVYCISSPTTGETGSGVYLQALVNQGARVNIKQKIIVGIPADLPKPVITPLESCDIRAVRFCDPDLPSL